MVVETFEKTLETIKAGGAKINSAEVDAAVLKKAQEEYAAEHPGEAPLQAEPEKETETVKPPVEPPVVPEKEKKPEEIKTEKSEKEEEEKPKALSDDEVLSAKEDTLTDADKLRRIGLISAREEAERKEISLYAQAEGLTEEEAKKAIESEKKLAEQYQNDPRKLSRTARYWQSQHAKLEAKVKSDLETQQRNIRENEILIQGKKMTFEEAKPLMVEAYRNEFSEKIADKSDDEVFEIAKRDYQARVKAHYETVGKRLSDDARSKRARMILELPEHAKAFRQEIEQSLNLLPDAKIVQEDYTPDDIISWARGRHYTPEKIKEIEDAAFKRGQENAKILGEKVIPKPGAMQPAKPQVLSEDKEVELLSEDQRNQALNMFDGIKVWDDKRKFKEFIAVMKETDRWNPKKGD